MTKRPPDIEPDAGRTGDDAAFERLFRAEYASLVHFAHRYVRDGAAAEDIVQDVFTSLWQKHAHLITAQGVRAYLFRSVRNRALNHLRSGRVRQRVASSIRAAAESVVQPVADGDDVARLRAVLHDAVAALPKRRRLIFQLSRDHGLSYAEIAQSLGISIKTVETQMGRALQAMREALERHSSDH
ncbi:MAG TPA: RNA polymerase sigma-70 factor [Longimicrobiales bacterium]|nr:RNA polymerase sigma-70 factor [Longimicrobiales bacterium]